MSIGTFLTAVDLVIEIPVTFPSADPWQNLTDVAVEARAGKEGPTGVPVVVSATVAMDTNRITLTFAKWTLSPGTWSIEVLGTKDGWTRQIELASRNFKIVTALKPQAD